MTAGSVLIVGASVAGVGAANELRRCGFTGAVTLLDGQDHLPYDRPPLSKSVLGGADPSHFHDRAHYDGHAIELRLGVPARSLDAGSREVTLQSGERLRADAILIATGARARPFPPDRSETPVPTLRDAADARWLRRALAPGKRLAIIGGGFIGAEVASAAAGLGLSVTVLEAAAKPFARLLGHDVASRLASVQAAHGVRVAGGVTVARITGPPGRERRLLLSDGTTVEADIVVAGIGSLPNIEWLDGSGVVLEDGVACDEHGRTEVPGIFAAGDAASWRNPLSGRRERHEHWTAAREQSRIVAQHIAGQPESRWHDFVPYVWSDLHGKRLQVLGAVASADDAALAFEDPAKSAFIFEYRRDGRLVGVVGFNAGARTMRYGQQLATSPP